LPAHPCDDVLVGLELAAKAVVLAQVQVTRTRIAMDHQHAAAVGGEYVTERGDDGGIGHGGCGLLADGHCRSAAAHSAWLDVRWGKTRARGAPTGGWPAGGRVRT